MAVGDYPLPRRRKQPGLWGACSFAGGTHFFLLESRPPPRFLSWDPHATFDSQFPSSKGVVIPGEVRGSERKNVTFTAEEREQWSGSQARAAPDSGPSTDFLM